MMFRTVAMILLLMGQSAAGEVVNGESSPTPVADVSASLPSAAAQSAVAAAREKLAKHLKVELAQVSLVAVEPRTWNDSHLGCGKPGSMALQVISEGFAVTLAAQGRQHRVHVAGKNNVVICDRAVLLRSDKRRPANGRGLDVMILQAREDLARQLSVPVTAIRVRGTQPQTWTDSTMDCPRGGEAIDARTVNGYRLSFQHASRIYTYHTDLQDVRACPAIEAQ